ncbi:3881_t:CDS:2, partial [Cetraspora pellucida]
MIITENDDYGSMATIKRALVNGEDIPFMPIDIEEYNEYINNTSHYVLRIYSYFVDGQKAVVTIFVPDNKNIDVFEIEIKNILANGKDERGVVNMTNLWTEHIKGFPISRYYKEPKSHICIITTDIKQRSIALVIILNYNLEIANEHKLETASDDLRAYYLKVAQKYRIPLSEWALLTKYEYNNGRMSYSARFPLCEHAFYVSINNYHSVEDPTVLYKAYPSSLITHDRALICLIDIETENEKNLLKAFALCWQLLASDIELTYNGSKYDWPFV